MAQRRTPITSYAPPGQRYEHIPYPTFEQLLRAAYIWDHIAEQSELEYAFVGSIVARFRGDDFQVHTIEILVRPSALEDDARVLSLIKSQRPEYLGITPTNRHIVVIDGNRRGIALQFFATGTEHYPNDFIPPYDSERRSAQHLDLEPTIGHMLLSSNPPYNRWVPFIRCRCLLRQRLLRFNQNAQTAEQKRRNRRDINDIETYLKCTAKDRDFPFPNHVARDLLPTVQTWINYADSNFYQFTWEAKNEWRRLGLDV